MKRHSSETKNTSTTSTSPDATVCKTEDEYVREKMRWVVLLANGETVFEDDDRPGLDERSAWKRLHAYCRQENTHIVEMWLQFRSNRVRVGEAGADGYYLMKSAYGFWGDENTYHAYIAGTLVDGEIRVCHWKVPELRVMKHETRGADYDAPSLIFRPGLTDARPGAIMQRDGG